MALLPLILAAATTVAPAPAPSPSAPLPTIVILHARPLCSNLHNVIMPFVVIERKNNLRFKTMDTQLGVYHKWYRPTSDAATDPNGSPEINGAQALAAAQIDQTAAKMYEDITHVERLLAQSWRAIPPGKNPQLDNLRDRASKIIELQRQIANRYEEQAGTYLNSLGALPPVPTSKSVSGDPALQSEFDLPALDEDPLAAAQMPTAQTRLGLLPNPGAQYGEQQHAQTSNEIVQTMIVQELKFVRPALDVVKECDGPAKP